VDRSSVKETAKRDPLLLSFLNDFENDQDYRLVVLGLDDCVGSPVLRERLRRDRAMRVLDLLGPQARTRVEYVGAAPVNDYTAGNSSSGGRAMNRSVLIGFHRELEGEPITVRPAPKPGPTPETEGCGTGPNAKFPASEVQAAHQRAAQLLAQAVNASKYWHGTMTALAKKHFKLTLPAVSDEERYLWGEVRASLNGMGKAVSDATYECEPKQSWFHGGCISGTLAVSLFNIHLCPAWWRESTPDGRAAVLLHEWAHKWGDSVTRIVETYCYEPEFRDLPAWKLVGMPDAYMRYIYELATGQELPC
jgi:hypothetical protein